MRKQLIFLTCTITVLLLISCKNVGRITIFDDQSSNAEKLVLATVKDYWDFSSKGDYQKITKLTGYAPSIFYTCYFDEIEKCNTKKRVIKDDNKKPSVSQDKNIVEMDSTYMQSFSISIIREKIPQAIFEGKWHFYSVEKYWIYDNEARVRIMVNSHGGRFYRDVLLFNKEGRWKIFRFLEINERKAFAPPKQKKVEFKVIN